MGRADLHSHTNLSDGLLSPDELIHEARRAGVTVLSITDHDTLDAYAQLPAADLGLELVVGLELSAFHDGSETHILGYFVDCAAPELTRLIERASGARVARAKRMLKRLEEAGISIPAEKMAQLLANNRVGRPHLARALVEAGLVPTQKDAFKRYLTPGTPGYERRPDLPGGPETVRAIVAAGGAAVLAHPGTDCLADARALDELVHAGLAGLEVYHPRHTRSETESLARFAQRRGLVATGGSDYHGEGREGARVGDRTVGAAVVDELRARTRKREAR